MDYKSILEGQVRDLQKIQDQLINEGDVKSPQITEISNKILDIVKYLGGTKDTRKHNKEQEIEEINYKIYALKEEINKLHDMKDEILLKNL